MKAESLKGLPPAAVIAAEIDPLRSEAKRYADRLKKGGLTVSYKEFKGATHEFFGMRAVVPRAKEAEQYAADALGKAFPAKVIAMLPALGIRIYPGGGRLASGACRISSR